MSNFKLLKPDCVFIHIPKTGGTSIRKGIWASRYEGPIFGEIPDDWNGFFKFAFVRHPFDRLISAWKMFTEGPKGDSTWVMASDFYPMQLQQFIDIVRNDKIIFDERRKSFEERIRHHTIPQTHPFNCLHCADFVGRFERLETDLKLILNRLDLSASVPKMHFTNHFHWSYYMGPRMAEIAYDFYRNDFEQLGYN